MDVSKTMNINTQCVECMCLMTLFQEHVSSKHIHTAFFELSEWQQAGYKQKIKWTLECDRCDFKTTSKINMFEHIANHQVLENTVQRITQSAASTPSTQASQAAMSTPLDMRSTACETIIHAPHELDISDHKASPSESVATSHGIAESNQNNVSPVKEEAADTILIHMEEDDIEDVNSFQEPPAPPPLRKTLNHRKPSSKKPMQKHSNLQENQSVRAGQSQRCQYCKFVGDNSNALTYHMRVEHKVFTCDSCHFTASKPADLKLHMTELHNSLVCIYCGIISGTTRGLKRHYSMDHGNVLKACFHCNFTTSNRSVLTHHVNREHFKRKPMACPLCDYIAYTKQRIREHMTEIHEKQTPFSCPICARSYSRKTMLKRHMETNHVEGRLELTDQPIMGQGVFEQSGTESSEDIKLA